MAGEEVRASRSKGKNNDTTQQTITITFVPETDRYERPKNMEEHIRSYFESINGINKRIIAEERKIIAQNRNTWPTLSVEERDKLLNDRMISTDIRHRYDSSDEYWQEKTPWQPEKLMTTTPNNIREGKTKNISTSSDSFSTPFQWATKSQRNLRFPEVKKEKLYNNVAQEAPEKAKPNNAAATVQEQTVKKLNNVEKSLKEKQIKTKNENIKGNLSESDTALPVSIKKADDRPRTSKTNNNDVDVQDGISKQPKVDEKQYMDGTKNIFEFLQSWNP